MLLFIKGQLIWAAHGRVISLRVLHDLQKSWKNCIKISKFCYIIVEARWDRFCLNLKYSNILSQCCYLSKGNSFERLMGELSPLVLDGFTKNVKNHTNISKFCNIIVEARWDKFCLNLKYSNILSQCCYYSKGNSFKPLISELYFWSTTQFSKKVKIPQKYVKFETSL